jgi:hypothetical protein
MLYLGDIMSPNMYIDCEKAGRCPTLATLRSIQHPDHELTGRYLLRDGEGNMQNPKDLVSGGLSVVCGDYCNGKKENCPTYNFLK